MDGITWRTTALGTVVELGLDGCTSWRAVRVQRGVAAELDRLEDVFSLFRPHSQLHRLRDGGTTTDPELAAVVELAQEWHRRTAGAFHPGLAPLRSLWARAADQDRPPTDDQVAAARAACGVGSMTPHLDLNGIAKGWIADRTLAMIRQRRRPPSSAWLSLGGDVCHVGAGAVRVGVENPARPYDNAAPLTVVELSNRAIATSGSAHRRWQIDGEEYGQIIDPRSGRPTQGVLSATVIAPDAATADVLATTATVLTPAQSFALVDQFDAAALIVTPDGTQTSHTWPR